jgi:release factor glutamine methyltransferase
MNVGELLAGTARSFENEGILSARLDAEVLLSRYLQINRTDLYTRNDRALPADALSGFARWVERRLRREPVAYIVGSKEFWSLTFDVTPAVLIPRPDTEIIVEEVLAEAKHCTEDCRILEIGTGSGAISITLAREIKGAFIVATDISPAAVQIAGHNARRLGVSDRIAFLAGDMFQPVSGRFDFVVSNPPYIADAEFSNLPVDVAGYEPETALRAPGDGTAFHGELITGARYLLKKGGWLFMEIGNSQKAHIEELFQESNQYDSIEFCRNYSGIDRVAKGRKC